MTIDGLSHNRGSQSGDGPCPSVVVRLPSGQLDRLAAAAATVAGAGAKVWAPTQRGGKWIWRAVGGALPTAAIWRQFTNTAVSPKAALLPSTEEVFGWRGLHHDLELAAPESPAPVVLFGLRPCDAAAFERLDQALLHGPLPDAAYERRRSQAVLLTWGCEEPGPACLCDACGLSPAHAAGDVLMLPAADELLLGALTAKGRRILEQLSEITSEQDAESDAGPSTLLCEFEARAAELAGRKPPAYSDESADGRSGPGSRPNWTRLPADPASTVGLFEAPGWLELARPCLSCGLCAYVCPTCHCFALSDEPRGSEGRRVRTWDSCQFREFMVAAGGHNPRPTKTERVRQRMMHKLIYHREAHGDLLCTGCGRCVLACPVGLHIAVAAEMLLDAVRPATEPERRGPGG